ncbi:glycosyltransferase family 39 protein [Nostoc sp. UHCC 0252]|uniref:glycosyltransferase family 39 protein n=1 Tax=Nostoc sp. UHCC 0252 TaxID=3110241 RepID=UPI002B211A55|nr:glycosyltransferase family 39 protein [Nostoc sp. UHCC 0252]MEA5600739.1 glycosyltransferase family 39 protein [Nostoc sp. UHCC 0252]
MIDTPKNLQKMPIIVLALSITYYIYTTSYEIKYPGLYYDETLFVNGALGGLDNTFIHKRIWGIPVMLMPYIGALKAYFFYPIFHFLGVSPETIRIPVILISAITLILSFYLGKIIFNQWIASLISIVLATDPSFIYISRVDFGPIVFMIFFKILTLFIFFKIISYSYTLPNPKFINWYILLIIGLILGFWDKLNFIWFMSALFICSVIFYSKNIIKIWKLHKSKTLIPTITFITIMILMIVGLILPIFNLNVGVGETSQETLLDRFFRVNKVYETTVNGKGFYEFIFNQSLPEISCLNELTFLNIIFLLIVLSLAILLKCNYKSSLHLGFDSKKILLFFTTLFALIYLQMVFTKQVGGPHHIMMLFPFQHFFNIAAALVSVELIIQIVRKWHQLIKILCITLVVLIFGNLIHSQIKVNNYYSLALHDKKSFSTTWSPVIYELSHYLGNYRDKVDSIVSADWGFHTQLQGLAKPEIRIKYMDFWSIFNDLHNQTKDEQEKLYKVFFKDKINIVLLHPENAAIMKYSRRNFIEFSSLFFKEIKLEKYFYNSKNEVIYEVYTVKG